MLDHLIGKPSSNFKRTQVLLTLVFGLQFVIYGKTDKLPKILQKLNRKAGQAPWRVALGSWLIYYFIQNVFLLVGLNAPDPLSRLYKRSFYRATWILTALDAGFFTAMPFKPLWLRHILSIVFSVYYLVFADSAEEKVRKTRATISVEQMRVSWDKQAQNPILSFISGLLRPRLTLGDVIQVERPIYNAHLPSIEVHRFYTEQLDQYADHDTILMQFPGGGFVAMGPPCHADPLAEWAKQTKIPVFSVNYKKAPEYPYPWPIEECFDLYVAIIQSKGKVLGLSGKKDIHVILVGDSAGGNISASVTLKILAHNQRIGQETVIPTPSTSSNRTLSLNTDPKSYKNPLDCILPIPIGVILIYPALDFEMSCWMSPSQLSLIRAESNTNLFRSKSLESMWQTKDHFSHASPLSVVPDLEKKQSLWRRALGVKSKDRAQPIRDKIKTKEAWASSRLAMTSRMSFFNDRVISPDLMRAMAILYLGPYATPDFENDYLLSPIQAPDELLAQFPKTYMICGEKDPLVDDTVIFAGRIRQAKRKYRHEHPLDEDFPAGDNVRVHFLEGISHAFLQMMAFLPEARQAVKTVGNWVMEIGENNTYQQTILVHNNENRAPAMRTVVLDEDHVAKIVTTEKDMIHRRKQELVTGLF